jgi:hypothetical protein
MRDFFGYLRAVASAWRGYIGIFTLALTLMARTIPRVEQQRWFAYVGPSLIVISSVLVLWAMYSVYHSVLGELRSAQSHLGDRGRMRLIRLEKLLNELRFNEGHIGSEPSFWRDDAWTNIDDALPVLPSDMLKDIQDYYMELRSARDPGSYSSPRVRYRGKVSSSLPGLIERLNQFINQTRNTSVSG